MNTKISVKLIKKANRRRPQIPPKRQTAAGPNRWATAVQSWVVEFEKRRGESPPAFDSLFNALPEPNVLKSS